MYKAIICRIQTMPHPNADKIQLGMAHGFQVIVGLDTQDGELGVFFPPDGQLSEKFAEANDLVARVDADGKKAGGYFGKSRRVRAQNFRGERSEGFWIPLKSLAFTGASISTLQEGDQFDTLNEVPICNKYYTPATLKAMSGRSKQPRKCVCFPEHVETKQLKYEADKIPLGSLLYVTEKLHGTSGRTGHVLDRRRVQRPIRKRIFGLLKGQGWQVHDEVTEWAYLTGTRRTILEKRMGDGFYGNEEFRAIAASAFQGKLHKGEVVYYEIVGYTTTGQPIMSPQSTDAIKDGEFTKKYGKSMVYKYGCPVGICDVYVYRIAMVNEDGHSIDLSWPQVVRRCKELGVKVVPDLSKDERQFPHHRASPILLALAVGTAPSILDPSHIAEGCVLRIENEEGVSFLKAKSHTFGMLEGYLKDKEEYVDTEEAA